MTRDDVPSGGDRWDAMGCMWWWWIVIIIIIIIIWWFFAWGRGGAPAGGPGAPGFRAPADGRGNGAGAGGGATAAPSSSGAPGQTGGTEGWTAPSNEARPESTPPASAPSGDLSPYMLPGPAMGLA